MRLAGSYFWKSVLFPNDDTVCLVEWVGLVLGTKFTGGGL